MKALYFDHAASTPVDPEVFRAMEPYFLEKFGNPGSVHAFGQEAIAAVDRSREALARAVGLPAASGFRQMIFTGSATEANNLAVRGALLAARAGFARGESEGAKQGRPRLIVSAIEHESILETARAAEQMGIDVVYVPVGRDGVVDEKKIKENLDERTVLVSIQYANNEIGVIQPITRIAETVRAFRAPRAALAIPYPLFHTDAVQAFQFLDCDVTKLGVDLMTLSAHKIYGPKGVGALYARDLKFLKPVIHGGGQEFGLRSGTENVPAIVGFAKAAELALAAREKESKRLEALRDRLWEGIKKIVPDAEKNPAVESAVRSAQTSGAQTRPLPNLLNVYFPGHAAQDLLTRLDLEGLAASSGSACRSRALEPSYVIEALGYPNERARSSIRLSLGRPTTEKDIDGALATFSRVCRNNK